MVISGMERKHRMGRWTSLFSIVCSGKARRNWGSQPCGYVGEEYSSKCKIWVQKLLWLKKIKEYRNIYNEKQNPCFTPSSTAPLPKGDHPISFLVVCVLNYVGYFQLSNLYAHIIPSPFITFKCYILTSCIRWRFSSPCPIFPPCSSNIWQIQMIFYSWH